MAVVDQQRGSIWMPLGGSLLVGGIMAALVVLGLATGSAALPLWQTIVQAVLLIGPAMALAWVLLRIRQRQRRLQHEQAVRRAEREQFMVLGRLAASIAHEVRNPLHNMRLLVDELGHLAASDEFPPMAERLTANIDRINHAVELVYRLARPGEVRTRLESHDHVDLLEILPLVRDRLPIEQRQRVVLLVPDGWRSFSVHGEREATQTIVENLLRNAIQATSDTPVYVDLKRNPAGDRFQMTVYNEGSLASGFHIPDIEHVAHQRDGARGLGLGVVIVNELAKQMRMAVTYASDESVVSFRVEGRMHQGLFDGHRTTEEEDDGVPRIDRR